jgi:hypothetical protein
MEDKANAFAFEEWPVGGCSRRFPVHHQQAPVSRDTNVVPVRVLLLLLVAGVAANYGLFSQAVIFLKKSYRQINTRLSAAL